MTVFTSPPSLDDPTLAEEFLRLAGDGDEYAAVDLVLSLLYAGMPAARIMTELIGRTQERVGELWAADEWSIAREHAAAGVSERAVFALAAHGTARPVRGRVTVACAEGEWHGLPARMLAEILRLDGWRTDFLGASVPCSHLVTHLHQTGPDAVAISCTLATRLPGAHAAISACQAAGVPVIAGGRGFGPGGRYAERLGADAWAAGAEEAAVRLAADLPPPRRPASLDADEYTYVIGRRPALIGTAMGRLAAGHPPVRDYDQRQLDATADDMGHIVDFLAAALYVGETPIFTDFVVWTRGVLAARGVPPAALRSGLKLVRDQLRDCPTAEAILDAGLQHAAG